MTYDNTNNTNGKSAKVFASIKFKDIWGKYLYVGMFNPHPGDYIRVKNFRIKVRADFYMNVIASTQLNYICKRGLRQDVYANAALDQWYSYHEYDDSGRADSSPYLFQVKIWEKQKTDISWKNDFKLETSNSTKFNTAVALLKYNAKASAIDVPPQIY